MESSKKIQAMKKQKRAHLVYNIILYTITSIITFLFFSYNFWFSSIYRLISSIPYDLSLFNNAKVYFIVANLIILFLIRESRLSKATLALDFYEEYASKCRSTNPNKVIMMSSLYNIREEEEITKQTPQRIEKKTKKEKHENNEKNNLNVEKIKKEDVVMRKSKSRNDIFQLLEKKKENNMNHQEEYVKMEKKKEDVIMRKSKSRNDIFQLEENKKENINHQEEYLKMEEKKDDVIMRKSKSKNNILQLLKDKKKENMNHQEKKSGLRVSRSAVWNNIDDTDAEMTHNKGSKEEKLNITTEDLNKRVEAFIARVNRQRLLES